MKHSLFVALSLVTVVGFTSCDDDVLRGRTLSGCWDGDFGMSYDYDYRGRLYTFDADYTDIEFIPYNTSSTSGYGYQVDFYRNAPYSKMYHSFKWSVENGRIYLSYRNEPDLDTCIRDYSMSSDYFEGYFDYSSVHFRLSKYEDFVWDYYVSDYGSYNYGTGYHYYDNSSFSWGGYYSPERAADDDQPSASDADVAPKVRCYNRYASGGK